jgi:hypothetical protein
MTVRTGPDAVTTTPGRLAGTRAEMLRLVGWPTLWVTLGVYLVLFVTATVVLVRPRDLT